MKASPHTMPVAHSVTPALRLGRYGHPGGVIWLTGLSGSGKSTLAMGLEAALLRLGYAVHTLDGDNLRQGLNAGLGFSDEDRAEAVRRAGEASALFAQAGLICITSLISPFRQDRAHARHAAERHSTFHEVYVRAGLDTCEARDPKGLYKKAREGVIAQFTGVSSPYDEPMNADLVLATDEECVEISLGKLVTYVCNVLPMAQLPCGERFFDRLTPATHVFRN